MPIAVGIQESVMALKPERTGGRTYEPPLGYLLNHRMEETSLTEINFQA